MNYKSKLWIALINRGIFLRFGLHPPLVQGYKLALCSHQICLVVRGVFYKHRPGIMCDLLTVHIINNVWMRHTLSARSLSSGGLWEVFLPDLALPSSITLRERRSLVRSVLPSNCTMAPRQTNFEIADSFGQLRVLLRFGFHPPLAWGQASWPFCFKPVVSGRESGTLAH